MRQLQTASLLKTQFITSQKHFLAVDDQIKAENSINIQDIASTSSGNLQIPVKIDEKPIKISDQSIKDFNNDPAVMKQNPVTKYVIDKPNHLSFKLVKPDELTVKKSEQNSVNKLVLIQQHPGAKIEGIKQVPCIPRYQLITVRPENNIRYRRMTHFESSGPRQVLNFEPFRPRLITNVPTIRPQLIFNHETVRPRFLPKIETIHSRPPNITNWCVRHPQTSSFQFKQRVTESQQPTKIVDKILLKFEKIDQNQDVKDKKILGTSNASKNIKKGNRNRRPTMKALELIKQEELDLKCPMCAEVFDTQPTLSAHLWSEHEAETFTCQTCYKFFLNQEELNNHINRLHQPKERNFKCTMCPKAYTTRHTLNRHIVVKHPTSKYRCNYNLCHQTFDTFDAMRSHMVSIHPEVKFRDMFNLIAKVEV